MVILLDEPLINPITKEVLFKAGEIISTMRLEHYSKHIPDMDHVRGTLCTTHDVALRLYSQRWADAVNAKNPPITGFDKQASDAQDEADFRRDSEAEERLLSSQEKRT